MTNQAHHRIDALAKGTILHAYRIKEELGSGAFGITYLAEHSLLNTQHVIKEYLPETALRDHATSTVAPKSHQEEDLFNWGMTSFFNEARILNQLVHPNIVKVSDLFEANGTAYFVMPYLKGITLHQWVKANPNASQQQLEEIFIPILEGLKYIHERNLLHRDIKPENIYITDNGNPVLIDFGAARLAIGNKSKALTQVLTPHFAPWEQYRSKGDFTPALDLYSLAGCIYQAITQKLPEEAPNRLEDDPQPKLSGSQYEGRYTRSFLQAVDQALSVWAKDRYQTAFEFQRALLAQGATSSEASTAATTPAPSQSPTTSSTDSETSSKKSPLVAILSSVMGVSVLAVGAWMFIGDKEESPSVAQTEEQRLWEQAEGNDDIDSYQLYLRDCDRCDNQAQAEARVEQLQQAEQQEAERLAEEQRLAEAQAAAEAEAQAEAEAAERREAQARAARQRAEQQRAEEARAEREQQQAQRTADQQLWEDARRTNSLTSYRAYLTNCALCEQRSEAQQRIADFQVAQEAEQSRIAAERAREESAQREAQREADERLWQRAQSAADEASFQAYLAECALCEQRATAETQLQTLRREREAEEQRVLAEQRAADKELFASAESLDSLTAWQRYLNDCLQCDDRDRAQSRVDAIEAELAARTPDERMWDEAKADDSSSAYARYLENCETCEFRAEAEQRQARTQAREQGIQVSLTGGDFDSIQAAINFALAGTTIRISPGVYTESITLDKDVILLGDGETAEVIIEAQDAPVLVSSGAGTVRQLTLKNSAMVGTPPALLVQGQSRIVLEQLIIESASGAAIRVQDTASPRLQASQLHSVINSALILTGQAEGEYLNNVFQNSGEYGVRIDSRGNPTFAENEIKRNERGGIALANNTRGVFQNNLIANNLSSGVLVSFSGNPRFIENRIQDNEQYGLQIFEQGRGLYENNQISGHNLVGILVRNGGSPNLSNNDIYNNQDGIQFLSGAGGSVSENRIRENSDTGIVIRGNSNPELTNNTIDSNQSVGVHIVDNGRGRFRSNTISNHSDAGVIVANGSEPEFRNNRIINNQIGVRIEDRGAGRYVDNELNGNTTENWLVDESATPVIED